MLKLRLLMEEGDNRGLGFVVGGENGKDWRRNKTRFRGTKSRWEFMAKMGNRVRVSSR